MFQLPNFKISKTLIFIILLVIFALYAFKIIDLPIRFIPLILIVSIYVFTCIEWNMFSKENIEGFAAKKGKIIIPGNVEIHGNCEVHGEATIGKNSKTRMRIKEGRIGNVNAGDICFDADSWKRCRRFNTNTYNYGIAAERIWVSHHAWLHIVHANHGSIQFKGNFHLHKHMFVHGNHHIHHYDRSRSVYGYGISGKADGNDGHVGFEPGWGRGLQLVGIKDGKHGRTVRLHSTHLHNIHHITCHAIVMHVGYFHELRHRSGDGLIWRHKGQFALKGDDWIQLHSHVHVFNDLHVGGNQWFHGASSFKNRKNHGAWSHINWHNGRCYIRGHLIMDNHGGQGSDIHCHVVHCHTTRFWELRHHSGDGRIWRHHGQFAIEGDDWVQIHASLDIYGRQHDSLRIFNNHEGRHYRYFNRNNQIGWHRYR